MVATLLMARVSFAYPPSSCEQSPRCNTMPTEGRGGRTPRNLVKDIGSDFRRGLKWNSSSAPSELLRVTRGCTTLTMCTRAIVFASKLRFCLSVAAQEGPTNDRGMAMRIQSVAAMLRLFDGRQFVAVPLLALGLQDAVHSVELMCELCLTTKRCVTNSKLCRTRRAEKRDTAGCEHIRTNAQKNRPTLHRCPARPLPLRSKSPVRVQGHTIMCVLASRRHWCKKAATPTWQTEWTNHLGDSSIHAKVPHHK